MVKVHGTRHADVNGLLAAVQALFGLVNRTRLGQIKRRGVVAA